MREKRDGNEKWKEMIKELFGEREEDMVCKERLKRIGKHFQLPRQRNWANTSRMVEKNADPT